MAFLAQPQDLTKAKERRVKEAENQEAREKRKLELKDTKAAKKSKLQHQKNAAQERQDAKLDPHRVDKLDVSCFRGVAVLKSVEDTEKVDGLLPFVVRAAGKLSAQLYDSITNLKFVQAMKNFQAAYRTTTATKATGRAQCDCSPAELQAHLRGGMRFFAKFHTSAVTDIGPSGNNVSMWGNVENMNFVATEFESVGQLRFLLKGRKQTMCAPATAVLDAMGKLKTDNQDALFRFMRNLTQKQKDDSGLVVYIADCIEGDISYMPCGGNRPTCCSHLQQGLCVRQRRSTCKNPGDQFQTQGQHDEVLASCQRVAGGRVSSCLRSAAESEVTVTMRLLTAS